MDDAATIAELSTRVATLEDALLTERAAFAADLAAERERAAALELERDRMRAAYEAALMELELLRRRIVAAKAERIDTAQLELEFAQKLRELDRLAPAPPPSVPREPKARPKPTGRRDLRESDLPVERIDVADPAMEKLVAEGLAERMGTEESSRIAYRRGGRVRVCTVRVKYRARPTEPAAEGEAGVGDRDRRVERDETGCVIVTAAMPPEILPRSIAAPSLLAKIATDKFQDSLPLFRQEERFAREGLPIDRGSMSRWLEELGNLCGATVVAAMREHAMKTAFCIATDATGVLVQPIRTHEKRRQECRRGHFFVQVADKDHVFFEYTPRETSDAVAKMFHGFRGYVQADAKSVYDILFEDRDDGPPDKHEVGCWAHGRRKFYEAAVTKDERAREALWRVHRIFELDAQWTREPPARRRELRDRFSRPHVEAFLAWCDVQAEATDPERGLLRTAFGYVRNQRDALARFLDDGRLVLDNNRSERELRRVAVGRKNWLFVGSDDHGEAAAGLLSLLASARLHRLDPEAYLRDVFRVLPQWPRDRYLELAPMFWRATRARLDPAELDAEIGWLRVPPAAPR